MMLILLLLLNHLLLLLAIRTITQSYQTRLFWQHHMCC